MLNCRQQGNPDRVVESAAGKREGCRRESNQLGGHKMGMALEIEGLSSQQLWDRARMSLAGGVSHDGRFLPPYPAYINKARGARKWDVEGREYIDYCLGSASMMLGHSHPDVVAAIKKQVDDGTFYATVHPQEIVWAELIQ
jgi:glutamate-1-semialdehyde aminotransferase